MTTVSEYRAGKRNPQKDWQVGPKFVSQGVLQVSIFVCSDFLWCRRWKRNWKFAKQKLISGWEGVIEHLLGAKTWENLAMDGSSCQANGSVSATFFAAIFKSTTANTNVGLVRKVRQNQEQQSDETRNQWPGCFPSLVCCWYYRVRIWCSVLN